MSKKYPVVTGVLDYFPLAIREVARLSKLGSEKHNPGEPMHWAREKSDDHPNSLGRHLMLRGTVDKEDGVRHSVKVAWRALAMAEMELEEAEREREKSSEEGG